MDINSVGEMAFFLEGAWADGQGGQHQLCRVIVLHCGSLSLPPRAEISSLVVMASPGKILTVVW